MMRKIIVITSDIIRCVFWLIMGGAFLGKGLVYLFGLILQGREVWYEAQYYVGIGFVKDDFAFFISIIFIAFGIYFIRRGFQIESKYRK